MSTYREEAEQRIASEQAAYWLCELADGQRSQRKAFLSWLKRSPHHVGEFLNISATWKAFGNAAPFSSTEIEAMVAEAKALKDSSNVVTLDGERRSANQNLHLVQPGLAPRLLRAAAAIGFIAVTAAFAAWWVNTSKMTQATAIGEQRALRLDDGSLLQLNTHSRIKVRFSERARDIELLEGEALFNVQRDPARPFRVQVEDVVIQAVGTQFNVHRRSHDVVVSVIEGRVRLASATKKLTEELAVGEEAIVGANGAITKQKRADISDAIAWRERRLVFDNDRLEDIVHEVNRYTQRSIRVEGAAADQRITGTFDADDPDSLLLFLRGIKGIRVEDDADAFVIRK